MKASFKGGLILKYMFLLLTVLIVQCNAKNIYFSLKRVFIDRNLYFSLQMFYTGVWWFRVNDALTHTRTCVHTHVHTQLRDLQNIYVTFIVQVIRSGRLWCQNVGRWSAI